MIAFGSITILLLFVGILFLTSYLFNRLQSKGKFLKGLFIGYGGILIISVIVYYGLSIEESVTIEDERISLYSYLNSGRMDEVDPTYLKERWAYSYEGDELVVETNHHDYNWFPVYVEHVPNQQQVEVAYYQLPTVVDGYNLSTHMSLPGTSLSGNTLTVIHQAFYDNSFAVFKPEFPFRHYQDVTLMPDDFLHGEEMLYIRIPENMNVIFEEDSGVHLVDDL